jgi:hypothetical protein
MASPQTSSTRSTAALVFSSARYCSRLSPDVKRTAAAATWITSREDLILSKLVWARDTGSEMQLRDVRTLIDESVDWPYLKDWAAKLGIAAKLDELSK